MDVMLDYSFNLGQGNLMLSVAGLHVLSCIYGRRKHTMCTVNLRIKLKILFTYKYLKIKPIPYNTDAVLCDNEAKCKCF